MPTLDASGAPIPTDTSVYGAVKVLSTRRIPWVRSTTLVVDAAEIGAETSRHGVFFLRVVPYQTFQDATALVLVAPIGYAIDSALDLDIVAGALFVQELDASGLLTNAVEFTVQAPSPDPARPGPFTTTVTIPIQTLYDSTDWYTRLYAAVQTIEANMG